MKSLPFAPFGNTDQNALNAAVEAWEGKTSIVGQEGMAFKSGTNLVTHVTSKRKPWARKTFVRMMAGELPRLADREFCDAANGPVISQPVVKIRRLKIAIQIAALVERFYR